MPSQPRQRSHFLFASYYPDNRVFWSFVVVWMVWFSGGCAVVPAHGLPGGGPANQPAVGPVKGEAGPGTGRLAGWPADGWRISTPEEQGLNSALILEMLQEIQKSELDIHSILVVRHGYLVAEVYFPPYQKGLQHPVFSVTKSVTSALVGIAIQEGYIKSVQQKVLDFFPEIAGQVKDQNLIFSAGGWGNQGVGLVSGNVYSPLQFGKVKGRFFPEVRS